MGIFNDKTFGDHVGHIENTKARGPQCPSGPKGEKGKDGIRFKLDPDNNFDLDYKKIVHQEVMTDYKTDDAYEYKLKDLKNAVNKKYLNERFLKKDISLNYFDLKGNATVIKKSEPYYDDLYDDNDLASKNYVDNQNAKQNTIINKKADRDKVFHHDGSNKTTSH